MSRLDRHGRSTGSLFDLLGHDELDATAATGFVCSRSPRFASALLALVAIADGDLDAVRLEQRTAEGSRTDIELETASALVVFEAKTGFALPDRAQLEQYARRLREDPRLGVLATITNAPGLAANRLPSELGDIPVRHLSWTQVHAAASSVRNARGNERFLLVELTRYLEGIMAARDRSSNLVYVVSLGTAKVAATAMDFRDVITKHGQYFHPAHGRKGFPRVPPNYLAFRFDGRLQSIHHVEEAHLYDMRTARPPGLPDLRHPTWWSDGLEGTGLADHILYTLGPAIKPSVEVRTGNLYRAARVWAAIDLLLTSTTIAEAAERTRRRETEPG